MYQTQIEFVKDLPERLEKMEGAVPAKLDKINNLKPGATTDEIITAFNSLLDDLKLNGFMKYV